MRSQPTIKPILSLLIVALWLLLHAGPVSAAVYACPAASGEVVYQDRPCTRVPTKQATTNTASSGSDATDNTDRYAFDMHRSWFVPPLYAPQPAYCDRLGCDCARQTRNFRRGLTSAVIDALFLETAWHRYAEQVIKMETDPPTGLAYLELKVAIEESACDIQMSQVTLKNYAAGALQDLKIKAEAAQRRGHTDYEQCDGINERVCADVDAYRQYERVLEDIETLKLPRYFLIADAE